MFQAIHTTMHCTYVLCLQWSRLMRSAQYAHHLNHNLHTSINVVFFTLLYFFQYMWLFSIYIATTQYTCKLHTVYKFSNLYICIIFYVLCVRSLRDPGATSPSGSFWPFSTSSSAPSGSTPTHTSTSPPSPGAPRGPVLCFSFTQKGYAPAFHHFLSRDFFLPNEQCAGFFLDAKYDVHQFLKRPFLPLAFLKIDA